MKAVQKFLVLGAVLAASSSLAFADPMTATIGVSAAAGTTANIQDGSVSFTNNGTAPAPGRLTSATGTLAIDAPGYVNLGTLSFTNTPGATSNVNEVLVSTLAGAPVDFTFTVTNILDVADDPGDDVVLRGTGVFSGSTFGSSTGTFFLSASDTSAGGASSTSLELTAGATAVTPEPNSLILMGTGLLGAAGLMFMRRRNADSLI